MYRTSFDDPRPATRAQLLAALDEVEMLPGDASALIYDSRDEEAPFNGWTAEISHCDLGEPGFSTCAWPSAEALRADLSAIGITLIEEV